MGYGVHGVGRHRGQGGTWGRGVHGAGGANGTGGAWGRGCMGHRGQGQGVPGGVRRAQPTPPSSHLLVPAGDGGELRLPGQAELPRLAPGLLAPGEVINPPPMVPPAQPQPLQPAPWGQPGGARCSRAGGRTGGTRGAQPCPDPMGSVPTSPHLHVTQSVPAPLCHLGAVTGAPCAWGGDSRDRSLAQPCPRPPCHQPHSPSGLGRGPSTSSSARATRSSARSRAPGEGKGGVRAAPASLLPPKKG